MSEMEICAPLGEIFKITNKNSQIPMGIVLAKSHINNPQAYTKETKKDTNKLQYFHLLTVKAIFLRF